MLKSVLIGMDWSIFEDGTTIPVEFHEDFFKANGNRHLRRGQRQNISLIINSQTCSTADILILEG